MTVRRDKPFLSVVAVFEVEVRNGYVLQLQGQFQGRAISPWHDSILTSGPINATFAMKESQAWAIIQS